ncbi:MAG: hypothetical protein J6I45_11370 [Clostridia bacterium]|nr:hypothetical protein [Clostridia bacterium]
MKKLIFLLIILLLLTSCGDGKLPAETNTDVNTAENSAAEESTAPAQPITEMLHDHPEPPSSVDELRMFYEEAERCYALFTGFASPEMGRSSVEVEGNPYALVAEFADMDALRSYTAQFFDAALTEELLAKETATGAPLYIERDDSLYRFGGYVGLWSYDTAKVTDFEFHEESSTLTVTAEVNENGTVSVGSFIYHLTDGNEGMRFTDFALMSELIWNSMLVMRPAYTEAGMIGLFTEAHGTPLFAHKIFTSRIYIFPLIEGDSFTLYYAEDYVSDTPTTFKKAVIDIPDEYDYDAITPLTASGGGGSGECMLYVRITKGEENRYLALYADAGSAYDDSGSFNRPLTFGFAYESSLPEVIMIGHTPDKNDVGAGLFFSISSANLNSLTSNLTSPALAGCPFEITFEDLPNVKITGHLHEKDGTPHADSITVGDQALLFDEAPEPLSGNFWVSLFYAEGVTVFDKLTYHVGDSYLFTDDGIIEFHEKDNESDTALSFFARLNGGVLDSIEDPNAVYVAGYDLCYTLYAKKYSGRFSQTGEIGVLEVCTGEDDFCYELGSVNFEGGSLSFIPETVCSIGALYDLDATFERAQRQGIFTEYESLEDLIEHNKSKAIN